MCDDLLHLLMLEPGLVNQKHVADFAQEKNSCNLHVQADQEQTTKGKLLSVMVRDRGGSGFDEEMLLYELENLWKDGTVMYDSRL